MLGEMVKCCVVVLGNWGQVNEIGVGIFFGEQYYYFVCFEVSFDCYLGLCICFREVLVYVFVVGILILFQFG